MEVGANELERYKSALASFDAAVQYAPLPVERIEVASPDRTLTLDGISLPLLRQLGTEGIIHS